LPDDICPLAISPAGSRILPAKEGHAMKRRINSLIQSLVLVRFGQQLGTDSDLARAVASGIDLLVSTLSRFLG
jgi:hypothetical protein